MLPKTISDRYKLYRQEELWGQSSSKKGLYIDKKRGKLVFVKVAAGGKQLSCEYHNQQFFHDQSKKLKIADVVVPKPLEIPRVGNFKALVMEYYPAKSIVKADVKTRLEVYMKALKFLERINSMTIDNESNLRRKPAGWQLVTLVYFLSKDLILYLSHAPLFLRAAALLFKSTSKWTKLTSNWICHGDINVTNVLLYEKKVIVCDFAASLRSHRYFDISRVLNSTWYQAGFHKQLWNRIVSEFRFTPEQQAVLRSFVILNLLERLSQRYTNVNQERFYLKRLEELLAL